MLNVCEVAALKGCSERYVKKLCKEGTIKSYKELNARNVERYAISVEDLEPSLQAQYYAQKKSSFDTIYPSVAVTTTKFKALDSFSADERIEIDFWIDALEQWQIYRAKDGVGNKAEVDKAFVSYMSMEYPTITFSIDILYRKYAAARAKDYDGLVDKRGKWRKGICEVPKQVLLAFQTYYLNEAQHPIKKCMEYTEMWARKNAPELLPLASYSTFRRKAKEIPYAVMVLGRMGEKAYYDLCSPHMRRDYESIASNDWWIADTHTFDIMTQGDNGKPHRIYINAFLDARSGIFTGWYITNNPSSDATLYALEQGIENFGIPYNIYVDNGREYLTFDIGGRGHRAKRVLADGSIPFEPPGVFKRLGINMTNAIVYNARAKLIERRFRDVKDHISRLFLTYTGGSVAEKPDRLKHILKSVESEYKADVKIKNSKLKQVELEFNRDNTTIISKKIVSDEQLIELADKLIRGYMNYEPYGGSVPEDVGKRRIDVFWDRLNGKQRQADLNDLSLLLMRSTRPQKIDRNGVYVEVCGKRIDFCNEDIHTLQGNKVYLRYNPRKFDSVRIYDMEDRFIMEVPRAGNQMAYGADKDRIAEGMRTIRKARRDTKEAIRMSTLPLADEDSALALVLAEANYNLDNPADIPKTKIIDLVRAREEPLLEAVGGNISIDTMLKNVETQTKFKEKK